MPLGSGNIIQTGTSSTVTTPATSVNVTLSSATTGNTVLIGLIADEFAITAPTGFVQDAYVQVGEAHHYVWRKQTSTAESSWTVYFPDFASAAWWVDEVSGLGASPLTAGISNSGSSVSSISTGTTPTATDADLLCIASYGAHIATNTVMTFSGETNSFTEAHDSHATWSGGVGVAIAEGRRFPGASGTYESTATISTTATSASGILVVYTAASAPATVIDDVTVGGTFTITAEVTSRSGGDTHLDLFTDSTTVQGSIVLHADLSVTGTMNYGTGLIGVQATSVAFTVGDVVSSDLTGECMVVRDSWIDSGGPEWSNTTTRATSYSTTGWTVIGSASIS